MKSKKIKIVQITNDFHLLDSDGNVWVCKRKPYSQEWCWRLIDLPEKNTQYKDYGYIEIKPEEVNNEK